jgi:hypothetical protein
VRPLPRRWRWKLSSSPPASSIHPPTGHVNSPTRNGVLLTLQPPIGCSLKVPFVFSSRSLHVHCREEDPEGWCTVPSTVLGSWEKSVLP